MNKQILCSVKVLLLIMALHCPICQSARANNELGTRQPAKIAPSSLADLKMSVNFAACTLSEALETIVNVSQVSIFYDSKPLSSHHVSATQQTNIKLGKLLDMVLRGSGFSWTENAGSIIVAKGTSQPKKNEARQKVSGVVLDANTQEPLPGATVVIKGRTLGVSTDLDGNFQFDRLATGEYTLIIQFIGYETQEVVVSLVGEKSVTLTVLMKEDIRSLSEVVVQSKRVRDAEDAILRERKNSSLIQDGISKELMERTASLTTAQALQKVSGVSVKDDRYVSVRGLTDRNVVVQLNGARLSSADPLRSGAVPLDILPVQALDNIIVQKTVLPDTPGDATGAVIELSTLALPDSLTVKVTAQIGCNDNIGMSGNVLSFPNGKLGFFGQHAKEHQLSNEFLAMQRDKNFNFEKKIREAQGGMNTSQEAVTINRLQEEIDPYLATSLQRVLPDQLYAASVSNAFMINGTKRISALIGGNYYSRSQQILNAQSNRYKLLDNVVTPNNLQLSPIFKFREDIGSQNILWGGVAAVNVIINDYNVISSNYIFNRGYESIGSFYSEIHSDDAVAKPDLYSYQLVTSIREFSTWQLKGDHKLKVLGYQPLINWNYSISTTRTELPDFRNSFLTRDTKNEIYNAYDITRYYRTLAEENENAKIDLQLPVLTKDLKIHTKVGMYFLKRTRDFNQSSLLTPTDHKSPVVKSLGSVRGDLNNWLTPDAVGIDENTSAEGGTYTPGFNYYYTQGNPNGGSSKYNATQRVTSAYGLVDVDVNKWLHFSGGMRVEDTDVRGISDSTNTTEEIRSVQDYIDKFAVDQQQINWLPSGTLIYRLNSKMNFRLAASKTLARPELVELVNFKLFDASQFAYITGNVKLTNALYKNLDFRWEFFANAGEVFSASVFYKEVENAIERVFLPTSSRTYVPISSISFRNNPSKGTVQGLEIEGVKYLGFISPALKKLRIGVNLMFAKSETRLSDEEYFAISQYNRPLDRKRPLFDQPNVVLNGNLGYEWTAQGLAVTFYYSYVGQRLIEINTNGTPNIFEYAAPQLDFICSKVMKGGWVIKGFAKNLLDGDTKYIYQKPGSNTEFGVLNQTYYRRVFSRGTEYSLGVSYVF